MVRKLKRIFYHNHSHSLTEQKGQGTVEYILILVVSIGLVLALAAVYAKPMRGFITGYLGGYFTCLLQTGELPKLASDQGASNSSGDCNAVLAAAISGGSGGGGFGSTGGAGKNGGKNGDKNANQAKASQNGENNGSSGGDEDGSGGGRGSSGSGGNGGGTRILSKRIKRAGEASPVGVTEASDGRVRDLGRAQDGKFFKGGNNGQTIIYITKRSNRKPVDGKLISDLDKRKIKKTESNIRAIASSEQDFKGGKKKMILKEKVKKESEVEAKVSFSISNVFRILLIIVIIGAIVLFVGGQAMQITKSWEK